MIIFARKEMKESYE